MTRRIILAAAFVLAGSAAAAEPALVQKGYAVARSHCGQCHALEGPAPSPNPGAPGFADIGRRYDAGVLPARIRQVTREGHYAMPVRRLQAWQRNALAAYIADAGERAGRN